MNTSVLGGARVVSAKNADRRSLTFMTEAKLGTWWPHYKFKERPWNNMQRRATSGAVLTASMFLDEEQHDGYTQHDGQVCERPALSIRSRASRQAEFKGTELSCSFLGWLPLEVTPLLYFECVDPV